MSARSGSWKTAGAGAVVLPSLFEEQIRAEERLTEMLTSVGADSSPEAGSYFPAAIAYNSGPSGYLDLVARARAAVDIPVIASLNGTHERGLGRLRQAHRTGRRNRARTQHLPDRVRSRP